MITISISEIRNLLGHRIQDGDQARGAEDDRETVFQIFLNFSFKKAGVQGKVILSSGSLELEQGATEESLEKIHNFIRSRKSDFWRVCGSGLHFSALDFDVAERVVLKAIKHQTSPLRDLLNEVEETELVESVLDAKFGQVISEIALQDLVDVCFELERLFRGCRSVDAGFKLLWMVKNYSGLVFEIPAKSEFREDTVKSILSQCISSSAELPSKYIELCLSSETRGSIFLFQVLIKKSSLPIFFDHAFSYIEQTLSSRVSISFIERCLSKELRLSPPLYEGLMDEDKQRRFRRCVISYIKNIPLHLYPAKIKKMLNFLQTYSLEARGMFSSFIMGSADAATAQLGELLYKAFKAETFNSQIPYFKRLAHLNIGFDHLMFTDLLNRPFVNLRENPIKVNSELKSLNILNFNIRGECFINGDLIITFYRDNCAFNRSCMPPYLLAFNLKTEELEWGCPLEQVATCADAYVKAHPICKRVEDSIAVRFKGSNEIQLINVHTGVIECRASWPYPDCKLRSDQTVVQDKLGYQLVRGGGDSGANTLVGGKFSAEGFQITFEEEAPSGYLYPLSTHIGVGCLEFEDENKIVIFSPTGESIELQCSSAYAHLDKLYTIEPNTADENSCILVVRTLLADHPVISAPEKNIILKGKDFSIEQFCRNGELVLYTGDYRNRSPIFVNMDTEDVVYSKYKTTDYVRSYIDLESAALWIRDSLSGKVYKVTSQEVLEIGQSPREEGARIVYADESNQLYYTVVR